MTLNNFIHNDPFISNPLVEQADLIDFNTMHLACRCRKLIQLEANATEDCIKNVVQYILNNDNQLFILSGGSNVILPPVLNATVLRPTLKGVTVTNETTDSINIEVMAGENWHDLVVKTVNNGWYGLENLALIPGLTGAAPVQNIGAYGVQLEDRLSYVRALHIPTLTWHTLNKDDCKFEYRTSKFKQEANEWLITRVGLNLHKNPNQVKAGYANISKVALQIASQSQRSKVIEGDIDANTCNQSVKVTPAHVMQAIIEIRQSKLPDPNSLPNCGSFFKNPIITTTQFLDLKKRFPNIVGYDVDATHTKVAAGWLIDAAGLKGKGIEPIMTHAKQALVLVNHWFTKQHCKATQDDVLATQTYIQEKVADKYDILLEREPVWVDSC